MDKRTLIARLRQLQASDKSALALYTELSVLIKDDSARAIFLSIAEDEKRHVALDKEALLLMED